MAYFEIGPTNIAPVGRLFVQQISLKQIGRNDETGIESVILDSPRKPNNIFKELTKASSDGSKELNRATLENSERFNKAFSNNSKPSKALGKERLRSNAKIQHFDKQDLIHREANLHWKSCRNTKNSNNNASFFGIRDNSYDSLFNETRDEYKRGLKERGSKPLMILFYNNGFKREHTPFYPYQQQAAEGLTHKETCPFNCLYTHDNRMLSCADVVVVHHSWNTLDVHHLRWLRKQRADIPWVWYEWESPLNTKGLSRLKNIFQLTASYDRSSDWWIPYFEVVPDASGQSGGASKDMVRNLRVGYYKMKSDTGRPTNYSDEIFGTSTISHTKIVRSDYPTDKVGVDHKKTARSYGNKKTARSYGNTRYQDTGQSNGVNERMRSSPTITVDYAKTKSKLAISFMSNCVGYRINFLYQLQQHIKLDVFGACFDNSNNTEDDGVGGGRGKCERHSKSCDQKQRQYKFFIGLENSFCNDYHTEKFYEQGLVKGLVPVIMAGFTRTTTTSKSSKYSSFSGIVAPPHSFINILDFPDMGSLAAHLNYLDRNDTAYNEYHTWRGRYTITRSNRCSLCREAHRKNGIRIGGGLNEKIKVIKRLPTIRLRKRWNRRKKCVRYGFEMFQKYLI